MDNLSNSATDDERRIKLTTLKKVQRTKKKEKMDNLSNNATDEERE
jgi:hypothetical protein